MVALKCAMAAPTPFGKKSLGLHLNMNAAGGAEILWTVISIMAQQLPVTEKGANNSEIGANRDGGQGSQIKLPKCFPASVPAPGAHPVFLPVPTSSQSVEITVRNRCKNALLAFAGILHSHFSTNSGLIRTSGVCIVFR